MVMERLAEQDRDRVAAAVAAAELKSDGEIVTIIAPRSDSYNDIAWLWSIVVMFLALAVYAGWPDFYRGLIEHLLGWRAPTSARGLLALVFVALAGKLFGTRLILLYRPLLRALVLPHTKAHRVRARAIDLFRVAVESRTRGKTGVLLYLSLAERRAEIVADEAIHGRVAPEEWGEAMAALIGHVREGRPGEGMAAAVERIGTVLAAHFPRSPDDSDELPDRLILL
jgi:putative membrane protein